MSELRTPRLHLRQWRDADLEPFAALSADAEVMRYFASPLGREESDAFAARCRDGIAQRGYAVWAIEVVGGPPFIGCAGIAEPRFTTKLTPALKVGWRLVRAQWGCGYA